MGPSPGDSAQAGGSAEIRFAGSISKELHRKAIYLHGRTGFVVIWVIATITALFLIFTVLRTGISVSMLPAFGLLVFWFAVIVLSRRTIDKGWESNQLLRDIFTGTATEWGLRTESAHGTQGLPWHLLHASRVTSTLVMVYQSQALFQLFAPDFFSGPEDWRRFCRIVTEKTPAWGKRQRRKTLWLLLLWVAIVIASVVYFRLQNE